MIRVSVIVATYKRDKELYRALESLAKQTVDCFEVVLIDDNREGERKRRVWELVERFKEIYPDLKLKFIVNEKNLGSAQTRNVGIANSEGEYVTFLDDDDVYLPEKIEKQLTFMDEGGYDYSITDLELFDENERLTDRRTRGYITNTTPEALRIYHLKYHLTGTDTFMFKREYIEKIGGFAPIDIGDEYYLMQRAIDGGGAFGYLADCHVKAYVHGDGGGLSSGERKIDGENALYRYKKTFFPKVNASTRRYVRMRHYAVIAYAQFKRRRLFSALWAGLRCFFSTPNSCVGMLLGRKK